MLLPGPLAHNWVETYWVVTPDPMQKELVREIVSHWTEGYGGSVNPDRKNALSLIRVCSRAWTRL